MMMILEREVRKIKEGGKERDRKRKPSAGESQNG
jgi:hypothetical protein